MIKCLNFRPKPIPKDALNLKQVMIAAAVKKAVDKEDKLKHLLAIGGVNGNHDEEIIEAIRELVKNTRYANKQNNQVITMAVKESLMKVSFKS